MARREKYHTIKAKPRRDESGKVIAEARPGRDEGKTFFIREMDADQAEDWGMRALLALTRAGAEIPDDMVGAGMAGIASMGLQALSGLRYEDVKPLFDQMFECVRFCPDLRQRETLRDLVPGDIEEVATRLELRREIYELHVNFSQPGVHSTSQPETPFPVGGEVTRTSPAP